MIFSEIMHIIDMGLEALKKKYPQVIITKIALSSELFREVFDVMNSYGGYPIEEYAYDSGKYPKAVLIRSKDDICLWWWNGSKGEFWAVDTAISRGCVVNIKTKKETGLDDFEKLFLKILKGGDANER